MKLLSDWKLIVRKAWSVRLALLSAVLSALEFVMQYLAPDHASGAFALTAGVVSLAAAVARLVAQPKVWKQDHE